MLELEGPGRAQGREAPGELHDDEVVGPEVAYRPFQAVEEDGNASDHDEDWDDDAYTFRFILLQSVMYFVCDCRVLVSDLWVAREGARGPNDGDPADAKPNWEEDEDADREERVEACPPEKCPVSEPLVASVEPAFDQEGAQREGEQADKNDCDC